MACLRKRISKKGAVYDVDFTVDGKRYIRSTKTCDLRVAKQILHDIQGKIARGKFTLGDYNKKQVKMSEFFRDYLDLAVSYKGAMTVKNERNYIKKFQEFAGDVPLQSVDARMMDRWKAHTLKSVSEVTFNIERRSLHAAFNVAVKWGLIAENPVRLLQKARPQEKRLYLTEAELMEVFGLVDRDIEQSGNRMHREFLIRFRLFLRFLLNTGLRRGEALRLRSDDIDLSGNVLHIAKTKSKQVRVVPMNRTAREMLQAAGPELFSGLNGPHVSRKFQHYLQRAGLVGFKLHSLRHSFATFLISQGVDLYTVSRLLGHSDIRTSMIYAKARTDALQQAVDRLEIDAGGVHSNQ